jgi:ubiquinone/menaquinone biosynthesis C-methylase UbiE
VKADYGKDKIDFRQMDAETLPYESNGFDLVISQMVLAFVPNQNKMISEMTRVTRLGGSIVIVTQGPEQLREAIEAFIQASSARYFFGYRIEFWPRKEIEPKKMLSSANLNDINTHRETWHNEFEKGVQEYDFYAATSGSWWSAKYPSDKVEIESIKNRNYFERNKVTKVTEDVVFAYGRKP